MHSLHYTYSAVSKPLISGEVYESYNSVELDATQMSLCNRVNKAGFMTQLCEESERLFNESDDLHYKQQWLQINIKTLMEHKRTENSTRDTDLHVLQWRHGCAVERHSNGSVMFLHGFDEYAYDGQTLTFDLSMHWKPLLLDHDIIWDRESVSSLERKCVETLTRFTELQREGKIIMESRPRVHTLVKASGSSGPSLLVCLATGFYPEHVQMEIRHGQTPFPDDQLNSEGIRPNADGSFQLKKSLEILPSERSQYQCVVTHQTLTDPLIVSWDEASVLLPALTGFIVALVVLAIILLVFYLLRKFVKRRNREKPSWHSHCNPTDREEPPQDWHFTPLADFCSRISTFDRVKPSWHSHCNPREENDVYCALGEFVDLETWEWELGLLEEIRPERCEAALNTDSEEEDPTDPSMEDVHSRS
ncbi:hypothetical protein R3I94_018549 [Phoxinus phoxinus]